MSEQFIGQPTLREKLEDLRVAKNASNIPWTEWEKDFLDDVTLELNLSKIKLSTKQKQIVDALWDKI